MNTTPARLPPRRRPTRKQLTILAVAAGVLVLACCGAVANALGLTDDPEPEATPTVTVTASATPTSSPMPEESEPTEAPEPEPEPAETEAPPPPPPPETDPRFGTCAEAIAAGHGPYYQGQDPEYDWYRDADSDGVVCER